LAQKEVVEKKTCVLEEKAGKNRNSILTDTSFTKDIRAILEQKSGSVPTEVWGRINNYLIYNRLMEKDVIEIAIDNIRARAKEEDVVINNISPEYLAYLALKHANSSYGMRDLIGEINEKIYDLICNKNGNTL
jgi:ATP-dependent Clp protease ATP-binding subunit ClpA